ncbi:MAG: hypothetical protein ACI96M_004628, partial [Candidatus Azotimanducaceae bacterium]
MRPTPPDILPPFNPHPQKSSPTTAPSAREIIAAKRMISGDVLKLS